MVRVIPHYKDVPPSPTNVRHLRKLHDYGETVNVRFPNNVAVLIIEFYQWVSRDWVHVCNHKPSCSEYARLAFILYGFASALFLSFEHLKECSDPFSDWPKEIKP